MGGEERREKMLTILRGAKQPVSGTALARQLGVSRQVIVQDIALLRAKQQEIVSTYRGYLIRNAPICRRIFKVHHSDEAIKPVCGFRRQGRRRVYLSQDLRRRARGNGIKIPPRRAGISGAVKKRGIKIVKKYYGRVSLSHHCRGNRRGFGSDPAGTERTWVFSGTSGL